MDVVGRRFLELLKQPQISETDAQIILNTFSENCNFCENENAPMDAVEIFGTRAAENRTV